MLVASSGSTSHLPIIPLPDLRPGFLLKSKEAELSFHVNPPPSKSTAPDIFAESDGSTVSSVYECDLPINDAYANKIAAYSRMIQMFKLEWEFKPRTGYSFFNSGVMLYNSTKMKSELEGMSPKQFLSQPMLEEFINGIGPLKWQSDQITLNYWFAKNKINVQRLDWKWNALYSAISNNDMLKAHFVHFFLKDKLPNQGENIEELMKHVS